MPIYGVKVRGDEKELIVRASSAAKARDHVVEAKALNAEIETASEGEAEAAPAAAGDPPASEEKPATDAAAKAK